MTKPTSEILDDLYRVRQDLLEQATLFRSKKWFQMETSSLEAAFRAELTRDKVIDDLKQDKSPEE
jgi:hypothetical protein